MNKSFRLSSKSSYQLHDFYKNHGVKGFNKDDLRFYTNADLGASILRPNYLVPALVAVGEKRWPVLACNNEQNPGYIILGTSGPKIDTLPLFPNAIAISDVDPFRINASTTKELSSRQLREYKNILARVQRKFSFQELANLATRLTLDIQPVGISPPQVIGGYLFDHWYNPYNVQLQAAIVRYEKMSPQQAITLSGLLCKRCRQILSQYYSLDSVNDLLIDHCKYCLVTDPKWHQNQSLYVCAAMDPKVFERFITFDSFFGNYMVKKYADILKQTQKPKDNPESHVITDMNDKDWDGYFEQMLLQVMDHSNDLRVQDYLLKMRHAPMDQVIKKEEFFSPYIRENKPSVYENFRKGRIVREKVQKTPRFPVSSNIPKPSIWEPRTIRRRYSANNFPIYPSRNIHWVKKISDSGKIEFKVLNFNPPKELGVQILRFSLKDGQGYRLFNQQIDGVFPVNQNNLEKIWHEEPEFTEIEV